jgi:hypothetical protein
VIGDSDIGAWRDGLRAMKQLGLRGVGGVPRAWLLSQELGYVLTPTAHESVALTDWQVDAPARGLPPGNLTAWAEHAVGEELAAGFARGELSTASLHDEPGCQLPSALPPVQNSTVAQRRWVAYLHASGLQPRDLGAAEWGGVLPNVTEGALAGASLAARRLRYWSIRYVAWDSSSYLASATHALEIASPGVGAYVNWSAFPCCTAQLIVCVRCYPNSDHYHRNVVA